ncbi:DUF7266 family protein [Natronorubrum sulfidifaciens]|uniref:Flagellin n=1 Tax=Natronorubrum sulfidifaciens JCM 14089 TaxID=1230460 RepID=L9W540_9EURY|nr:hypothetical protein [Natronorubrum sulfidifaciens]ELY44462.1 hypothetical protein C495_11184 [Natronorubrum sulfidifaciens JCM 14089]
MIGRPHDGTDRGMSIALTHVLTIGITTILIAMLLMSGSTMLDSETERSTQTSLETIGERLAGDIDNVDRAASTDDSVTLTTDHPQTVTNSRYTVELLAAAQCDDAPLLDGDEPCLKLSATDIDVTVYIPVVIDADIGDEQSASGGSIEISSDGDVIELTEANR